MAEKKIGRPRKLWTDDDVELFKKLCAIFCTRKECANILNMDVRTLDANIADTFPDTPTWAEAFEKFSATGRATLRRKLFELAQDGDKTALIYMSKNYLGMSDDGLRDAKAAPPTSSKLVSYEGARYRRAANG